MKSLKYKPRRKTLEIKAGILRLLLKEPMIISWLERKMAVLGVRLRQQLEILISEGCIEPYIGVNNLKGSRCRFYKVTSDGVSAFRHYEEKGNFPLMEVKNTGC